MSNPSVDNIIDAATKKTTLAAKGKEYNKNESGDLNYQLDAMFNEIKI